jgi:Mg/Co/Ni transporter MgtE
MTVQSTPARSFPTGSIVGFILLALALYWLAILFNLLPEKPQLVAVSFLILFLAGGAGRLGLL